MNRNFKLTGWLTRLGVFIALAGAIASPLAVSAGWFSPSVDVAPKWGVFEHTFKSEYSYSNALTDVTILVEFTSPEGDKHKVWGFWDGGKTWRVRFSPDFPGKWKFKTSCSDPSNAGLDNVTGDFVCSASMEESIFDLRGPVQVARDHYHLEYADHTPFFWLSDNAGGGAVQSTDKQWEFYALVRAHEGFTATEWKAGFGTNSENHTPFEDGKLDVAYFKALDAKVRALNRAGLLDVIIPFSGITLIDSGHAPLSEDQAIGLLRYMVARWGADNVAWLLPCDDGRAGYWKKVGGAVFGHIWHAPVVLAADEDYLVVDQFRNERWVDVFGYLSGRDAGDDGSKELLAGPATTGWKQYPPRPSVNLMPTYENEANNGQRITAQIIRRTAGLSLLTAPTAGIGYGTPEVWKWNTTTNVFDSGSTLADWQISLYLSGAKQLGAWANFFKTFAFGGLRPAPELLVNQSASPAKTVVASINELGDTALLYFPDGGEVELKTKSLPSNPKGTWVNGATAEKIPANISTDDKTAKLSAPGAGDWFLLIQAGKK